MFFSVQLSYPCSSPTLLFVFIYSSIVVFSMIISTNHQLYNSANTHTLCQSPRVVYVINCGIFVLFFYNLFSLHDRFLVSDLSSVLHRSNVLYVENLLMFDLTSSD